MRSHRAQSEEGAAPSHCVDEAPVPHQKVTPVTLPPMAFWNRTPVPQFRYSRWDGTQTGFDIDADSIFGEITDDLLYHGDLNAALRRLMQSGFRDRNDERVKGMRELMEQLRRRRRD